MRKFYSAVDVIDLTNGFSVTLDQCLIKTPDKKQLVLPKLSLAEAVADEWRAQKDNILPDTMPLTRLCNTAIDRVGARRDTVTAELLAYGHTDLLCYRASEPPELVVMQTESWQPILDWLQSAQGVHLKTTTGILPVTQTEQDIAGLKSSFSALLEYELTAFHSFVVGFGSIALALALIKGFKTLEECWQASILEQTFQEIAWGTDQEVEDKRVRLNAELKTSHDFWHFLLT